MTISPLRKPLRVLLVEDNKTDAVLLLHELKQANFDVTVDRVETAEAMRTALHKTTFDIVLSDFSLPGFDAISALGVLEASGADIPFIVVSGALGEEATTSALRAGARGFVAKGSPGSLAVAIERELRKDKVPPREGLPPLSEG